MSDFEWHDEDEWSDEPVAAPQSTGRPWWRRIGRVVVVLALLAGGGWLVWRSVEDQAAVGTAQVEADVRAAFELVERASRDGDIEVFTTVLSGSRRDWTIIQQQLVAQGHLFDRSVFGLALADTTPRIVSITFSPDLYVANVIAHFDYQRRSADGAEEAVTLAHILTFRRARDRWVMAPEDAGYWGTERALPVTNRFDITFAAAERDSDIARELSEQLIADFAALCEAFPQALRCTPGTLPDVSFSTDSIFLMRDYETLRLWAPEILPLPTPTRFGRPIDDAGQAAVLDAYRRFVLPAFVVSASGYNCCDHELFARALMNDLLARRGLAGYQPPAPQPESGAGTPSLEQAWNTTRLPDNPTAWSAAAERFVDYWLTAHPAVDPAQALALIGDHTQSLAEWIAALSAISPPETPWVERRDGVIQLRDVALLRWQSIVQEDTLAAVATAASDNTVVLRCTRPAATTDATPGERLISFYALTPGSGRWREWPVTLSTAGPASGLFPLRNGFFMATSATLTDPTAFHILTADGDRFTRFYIDQPGRPLTLTGAHSADETRFGATRSGEAGWLSLDACGGNICLFEDVGGVPLWSPWLDAPLVWTPAPDAGTPGTVQVGTEPDALILETAARPVWLPEGRMAVLSAAPTLDQASILERTALGTVQRVVRLDALRDLAPNLPPDRTADEIRLYAPPAAPNTLLVVANWSTGGGQTQPAGLLAQIERSSGEITVLTSGAFRVDGPELARDNGRLAWRERPAIGDPFARLRVASLPSADAVTLPAGDAALWRFSADGDWLAQLDRDVLAVTHVNDGTTVTIPLTNLTCDDLLWIDN